MPSKPAIHNDLFMVDQENNTLTLECEASIGLPPAKLRWLQASIKTTPSPSTVYSFEFAQLEPSKLHPLQASINIKT